MNELSSSGQNNLNNMRPMLGGFQIGLPGLQAAANFANANGYIQEVTNPQQVCTPRIRRDKTMAEKFMQIPNNDTQNYSFYRSQLVIETFEHST